MRNRMQGTLPNPYRRSSSYCDISYMANWKFKSC